MNAYSIIESRVIKAVLGKYKKRGYTLQRRNKQETIFTFLSKQYNKELYYTIILL